MGTGEQSGAAVEALLVEALSTSLTRRMAERIVADVRRNRADAPLPRDVPSLLDVVRGDVARAAFLRVGARARELIADVEERVLALGALPAEAWQGPRVRLVYVGRHRAAAAHVGRILGAQAVVPVEQLFELLMAVDGDERTLVVVDEADTSLTPALVARFVLDFPAHVLTFVASASPATREAFLSSGAASRATLRSEPMDHPDIPRLLRDVASGVLHVGARRPRGGTSTTTEPRRAA